MSNLQKKSFYLNRCIILATLPMLGTAALPAAAAPTVEEVIVTAQKREQNILEVPIAMSAFSSSQLDAAGASTIIDIEKSVPNAQFRSSRGTNSTLTAFIRGVGQQDPLWGFEPGVGVYLDDVYIARPQGAVLDLIDLERVEVLRGPQGTLYGKNTIGGAIKYVTKKMSGEVGGELKATIGSYDQRDFKVASQVPLIADKLYAGFAFGNLKRDGFGTQFKDYDPNTQTFGRTEENYNKDVEVARASLEYSPNDDLFFRFAYDELEDRSNNRCGSRIDANDPVTGSDIGQSQVPGPVHGETFGPLPDVFDSQCGMSEKQLVDNSGWSLTGEWSINEELSSKLVFAKRDGGTETFIDFDGTPLDSFEVPAIYKDEQTTAELQINWTTDSLAFVGGLFYYDGTAAGAFDALFGHFSGSILDGSTFTNGVDGEVDTKSTGAYANLNWSLSEALTLTVGGRFTRDEKEAIARRQFIVTTNDVPGTTSQGSAITYGRSIDDTLIATRTDFGKDDMNGSWSEFSPTVKLDYKVNEDVMTYLSYSQGFKSGGFDMRTDAVVEPNAVNGFDPETVDTYELGVKAMLADSRVRLAANVFYSDYNDQQVTVQAPAPAPAFFSSTVVNAGESEIKGLEVEAVIQVTDDFMLSMALGLLDAEFKVVDSTFLESTFQNGTPGDATDDTTATQQVNIANGASVVSTVYAGSDTSSAVVSSSTEEVPAWEVQNAPEKTFQIAGAYDYSIGEYGTLQYNLIYSYRDKVRMFDAVPAAIDQGSYSLFDASIVWISPEENWTAILAGKNLRDKEYRTGGYNFVNTAGEDAVLGFYGAPRTVSLTIGYQY